MKLTKAEKGKFQLIISDIAANASLIEMGAVETRDKIFEKIDDLIAWVGKAEVIEETAGA